MASLKTLVTVAVVGAPVSLFGALYFTSKKEGEFVKLPLYSEALNITRHYKPAVEYLGQPLQPKYLYPWNRTQNYQGRFVAKLSVPISGPLGGATLYIYGIRRKASEEYIIDHLDIYLEKIDKTWTFYSVKHDVKVPSFEELYAKSLSTAISGVKEDDSTKVPSPEEQQNLKYLPKAQTK